MKPLPHLRLTTPIQFIADYTLRFIHNNPDAKLFEAKKRLEQKIELFVSDGQDEQVICAAFATALSSRSSAAFKAECEAQLTTCMRPDDLE